MKIKSCYIFSKISNFVQQMLFFVFVWAKENLHFCIVDKISTPSIQKFSMRLFIYIKPLFLQRSVLVILIAALWLFTSINVGAQGWEMTYGETFNDENIEAVTQTLDEGYIIAGFAAGPTGQPAIYLVKTDVDGTRLWEKKIDRRNTAGNIVPVRANTILELDNGDLIIGGYTGFTFSQEEDFYVGRFSAEGDLIWESVFGSPGTNNDRGQEMILTSANELFIVGRMTNAAEDDNLELLAARLDLDGNLIGMPFFPTATPLPDSDEEAQAVIETTTGDFIIVGSSTVSVPTKNKNIFIQKINTSGFVQWDIIIPGFFDITPQAEDDEAFGVVQIGNTDEYGVVARTGFEGDLMYLIIEDEGLAATVNLNRHYPELGMQSPKEVIQSADNNLIIVGEKDASSIEQNAWLVKMDLDGDTIWTQTYGKTNFFTQGFSVSNEIDGGYIIGATTTEGVFPNLSFDPLLIKTDAEGRTLTNYITGTVFVDANNDCINNSELGLKGWAIEARNTDLDTTYYGFTQEDGSYSILAPKGNYEVSARGPNQYWEPCTSTFSLEFDEDYESAVRGFGLEAAIVCPDLEVDVSTGFVEVCESTSYEVTYCNNGTQEADDPVIKILIDDDLTFNASSTTITPDNIDGNEYTFNVADLAIGDCASFEIVVDVDCDARTSQAHCLKASITPDDNCLTPDPSWNQSSLIVRGECDGDSIRFEVENIGAGTYDDILGKNFVIVEDDLIFRQIPPGTIEPGEQILLPVEADGSTYRIITDQSQGHPGNSKPTVAIEGCDPIGDYSVGFLTQFEEDDRDPFVSTDCQENLDISFQKPNFKRGYPKGYGNDAEIEPQTDLKYIINFQNVGIDTAIRVVIRDTLSPWLDPASVRPGASSHDYTLEVYDEGVLKFTFNNILLADSSASLAESYGYVKYRISQKPDNPPGTRIKNGAAVYFDYQVPGSTEQVCHTIQDSLNIRVSNEHIAVPEISEVKVYPNPFRGQTTFEIISDRTYTDLSISIYSIEGKLIRRQLVNSSKFELIADNLKAGYYVYKIEDKQQLLSTGKLLVQ